MRFNPISLIFIKTKEYTTVHLQMSLPYEIIKCGLSFFNITPTKFLTRLHSSFSRFYFAIETTFKSPAFLDPEIWVYEVIYRTVCKMQARQVYNLKSANLHLLSRCIHHWCKLLLLVNREISSSSQNSWRVKTWTNVTSWW